MQTEPTSNAYNALITNAPVLFGLLAVSWFFSGFMFGGRGFLYADDWLSIANSATGMYPYCTGVDNWVNPWRPFYPPPVCLIQTVFGPNTWVFNGTTFAIYALTAFAWFGIVRNVFKLSSWIAFVVAVLYIAVPDDEAWLASVGGFRLIGPMLTLYGSWLVLSFWDYPGQHWRLIVGCVLAAYSFLVYEILFALWTLGVPLALFYKSRRISLRLVVVTGLIGLVSVTNLLWRFVYLPTTYDGTNAILGAHGVTLDWANVLRQVASSLILPLYRWVDAVLWIMEGRALGAGGFGYDLYVLGVAGVAAGLTALLLVRLRRVSGESQAVPPTTGRNMFVFALLIVPLAALPYYVIYQDVVFTAYRSLGTSLTTSLLLVALFVTPVPRRTVRRLSVLAVVVVMFKTAVSGYHTESWQYRTSIICDFHLELASHIEQLPQGIYVAVTSDDKRLYEREPLSYFWDSLLTSSVAMMLYHPGPYTPESYELSVMGHSGYLVSLALEVEPVDGGAVIEFPPEVQNIMHGFRPLPDVFPEDDLIVIDYTPFERFDIVAAPQRDDLVLYPDGDARGRAYQTMSGYCDWYTPQ